MDRRLGAWVGGVGRDPSDETKVMSFRDEMRVNEREREASGNILINR